MTTHLSPSIWVILPAFNEKKYLGEVLRKTLLYSKNIIVIDDGSNDDTFNEALKYTNHVLRHDINLGKGAALRTGCEYAFTNKNADAVILMDSDDQHDPKELLIFKQELKSGSKLILGIRSLWEMPIVRSWGNRMVSALVVVFFGRYIPDILSGYKAFTKDVYKKIIWKSQRYDVELEIASKIAIHKLPFKTVTVSTIYHDFNRGMTVLDSLELLIQIIMLRLQL